MLNVTVDIFSGRPDPSFLVEGTEANQILQQINANRGVIAGMGSGRQGLGYRGVRIEILAEQDAQKHDFPEAFMIANGASADESKGMELAARLIEGMTKWPALDETKDAATPRDEDMQKFLLEQLKAASPLMLEAEAPRITEFTEADGAAAPETDVTCYYETTAYNPGFWNNDPSVRSTNNCYNYGTNRRTNTFAQPGRASGRYPYPMDCPSVTAAALSDGAHQRYNCFPDSEKPRWFMAMAVWPGRDYHWYRKAREGFWGHKPGSTAVRNVDNSGVIIRDPSTCNRGPYVNFCGFFYACKSMRVR
jgi:hypothetical protein